ncbi:MAG: MBL fold metallo-hydrolase [Proteobacteria bacterium]|nr:MBL fold metallo-hydrolase [Pseudomonadota bacterium]
MNGTIVVKRRGPCTTHTYISPVDGEMVCSHIIETARRLVVVDAQLLVPYAREVREYADALGKPIDRVVVTHTHPDHWMGLEAFFGLHLSALPETADELARIGEYLLDLKRKTLGDRIARRLVLPIGDLAEGDADLDGVTLRCRRLVDTEAPLMALFELPEQRTLVAQDLVYNRVFPVVGDKNAAGQYLFDGWMRALREAQAEDYDLLLAGHGEPTSTGILGELLEYIEFAKGRFEAGAGEQSLRRELVERYPGYRVPEMLDLMSLFLYHRTW